MPQVYDGPGTVLKALASRRHGPEGLPRVEEADDGGGSEEDDDEPGGGRQHSPGMGGGGGGGHGAHGWGGPGGGCWGPGGSLVVQRGAQLGYQMRALAVHQVGGWGAGWEGKGGGAREGRGARVVVACRQDGRSWERRLAWSIWGPKGRSCFEYVVVCPAGCTG